MKDVTATSFGLLIAFLLPGLTGLFALAFWLPFLQSLFQSFLRAESGVGLFLLVVLAALVVGLEVTLFRWLLYERLLCRSHCLQPGEFASLASGRLESFRAAVDEHYRYHQFWGGMSIVIPLLGLGWLQVQLRERLAFLAVALATEALTIVAAMTAFRHYVNRARQILKGEPNAERVETRTHQGRSEGRSKQAKSG